MKTISIFTNLSGFASQRSLIHWVSLQVNTTALVYVHAKIEQFHNNKIFTEVEISNTTFLINWIFSVAISNQHTLSFLAFLQIHRLSWPWSSTSRHQADEKFGPSSVWCLLTLVCVLLRSGNGLQRQTVKWMLKNIQVEPNTYFILSILKERI